MPMAMWLGLLDCLHDNGDLDPSRFIKCMRGNHLLDRLIIDSIDLMSGGVRLWGVLKADNVWLTCCALHNWLLEIDGFGGVWNGGVA